MTKILAKNLRPGMQQNSCNLTLPRLTDQEFWTISQRLLVFEAPAQKWLHLKRWLMRLGRRIVFDDSDFFAPERLRFIFQQFLGGEQLQLENSASGRDCRLFSTLMANEEGKRFSHSAFTKWQDNSLSFNSDAQQAIVPQSLDADLDILAWMRVSSIFAPHWQRVTCPGPWSTDVRADFIKEFFARWSVAFDHNRGNSQWSDMESMFADHLQTWRSRLPGNFLPDIIVLVEGATETILLPFLAKRIGVDLSAIGAMIVPSGGANQVVKKYCQLKEIVNIPIFCLLDRDAAEQGRIIQNELRSQDCLYVLEDGEIECLFPLPVLVSNLNIYLSTLPYFSNYGREICLEDFSHNPSRSAVLDRLWRERKLGKFNKVDFAYFIANSSSLDQEITVDGWSLIKSIVAKRPKTATL